MNIGEFSGCLHVIGTPDSIDIEKTIDQWIQDDWEHGGISIYRRECYQTKDDFVKDYRRLYQQNMSSPPMRIWFSKEWTKRKTANSLPGLLFHPKKPNTEGTLIQAIKKKCLYRVKCTICHREFYTDEESFHCVKWKNCCGAECSKTTVVQNANYNNSIYPLEQDPYELQIIKQELSQISDEPLLYYGGKNEFKIAYISDMHLSQKLDKYDNNVDKMLRSVSKQLYRNLDKTANLTVFVGDLASSSDLVVRFFEKYRLEIMYSEYKEYKRHFLNVQDNMKKPTMYEYMKQKEKEYEIYVAYLNRKKKLVKKAAMKEDLIRKNEKEELIKQLRSCIYSGDGVYKFTSTCKDVSEIKAIEDKIGKKFGDISFADYFDSYDHEYYYSNIIMILGNHEYIGFNSIKEAETFYLEELTNRLGITVLLNEDLELTSINGGGIVLFGGTGFAKYDEVWNANRVICCNNFSREDEIKETTQFEKAYMNAYQKAKDNNYCFISFSHYPINACLNGRIDKEAIYFTGHTHKNQYSHTDTCVLYADNQVGYEKTEYTFSYATTGIIKNPYASVEDGIYETTIEDYLEFYRYLGESIGDGSGLYKKCSGHRGKLYLIKKYGYYGFFLVAHDMKSCSTSIVNGGSTRIISQSDDLEWIWNNFDTVCFKYLEVLSPLRQFQEKISQELQTMEFSGKIHGLIVDIDYYHHVLINPVDGKITLYYSPSFGIVHEFLTFEEVLDSIESHQNKYDAGSVEEVRKLYLSNKKSYKYLANIKGTGDILSSQNTFLNDSLQKVDTKGGMYGISRKINPLQRLFEKHVLRDFNVILTETKQESYRKLSYLGSTFLYEDQAYEIIEDEGGDVIIAQEIMISGSDDQTIISRMRNVRKFALVDLKSQLRKKEVGEWIHRKNIRFELLNENTITNKIEDVLVNDETKSGGTNMLLLWYPKCSTCQKAKKWLDDNHITVDVRHIVDDHPTYEELKTWHTLSGLPLKKFFNTSGLVYKELQLKEKLPLLTEEEQLKLLATNGKLVKRPLVILEDGVLVGFKEVEWKNVLS